MAHALSLVGLAAVGGRPVRAYSLGMRQRLGLAGALLRQPELLVLDEPTNGLDPQGILEVRGLLQTLNAAGTTVFLSSHLLAEVEELCTRIGLLDRGRLVVQDGRVERRADDRLFVRGTDAAQINALLVSAGLRVVELGPEQRRLEDVIAERTSARAPGEVAR